MDNDSPFYLGINHRRMDTSYWYKNVPMGVNALSTIMKKMVDKAGICTENISNHSIRKTLVKRMKKTNVSATDAIQKIGHCSLESLPDYDNLDSSDEEEISKKLDVYNAVHNYQEQQSTTSRDITPSKEVATSQNTARTLNDCLDVNVTSVSNKLSSSPRFQSNSVFNNSTININIFSNKKRMRPVIESDSE